MRHPPSDQPVMRVRADAFKHTQYAGIEVQLDDDHRDFNDARSWRVLTGPLTGLVRWFKDEHLEPIDERSSE